ncbi:hypothetical protein BKA67DRAFT_677630 [Truncatella angustata]|uniref:Zn(2)-C6 fungal-type domain-containing protein n=1 Tax=Truncatella angustata TaxID=152316 RepID=A0A9P8ZWY5_9PEZI|nr:uncharacterized protein BKA67DRAFT_677630 [Truncatella angustata]KAH6652563.1 hypothetical protein BKA67DRAFT_677630 [Truncatella angustata]
MATKELASCKQCRRRKVKCDRTGHCCGACSRLRLNCSFGNNKLTSVDDREPASHVTEAGIKRLRARNACQQCRSQKARCSGTGPCERCQARGENCELITENPLSSGQQPCTINNHNSASLEITYSAGVADVNVLLLDRSAVKQYIEAYFDNIDPISCVFLHRAKVLSDWSRGKIYDDLTVLICALGLLHNGHSQQHRDVSRCWVRAVQSRIMAHVERQTLDQLQNIVLLVQYHFLISNIPETWNLISLAARLAFTLRLNYEHHGIEPAKQESQRRLLWAIYQLDRMLSGGVEDLAVCPVERMHIRLPCDDHSFHRDIPSRAPRLNDYEHSDALSVGILAYHIRLNATRDRILRYTKRIRREGSAPSLTKPTLQVLEQELKTFLEHLPDDLKLTSDQLLLMSHTKDAQAYNMLHIHWLQCHCDLYRFLIPGIRESVDSHAFRNTPTEYVDYCQKACLESALRLCDLWTAIAQLEFQKPVNDVFFAISIYQVTQIINHLCQLLPQNGPHCLQNVKASLYGALDLAKPLRKMYPRVESCLKDIGHLLQVLGQNAGDMQKPTNRGPQPNLHHLPSLHSLIPEYSEQNGVVIDLPALGISPRTVAAPEPLQAMSTQPPHTLPVIPQLSDHIVRPYLQSGECDSLNFVEQTEFEPANIFDMQFNGYYDPVQNDLISAFVV